ncbi:MAG: hypothetical protein H6836_00535 [Planctomycetes bacterium]|nr:hypothetical protein [Planctomycetota bacterium]MCB9888028.1 hypothetical protein [Planctomycetota bacterium]
MTAPSELGRVSADQAAVFAQLLDLHRRGAIEGAILLATCNRVEVIIEADAEEGPQAVAGLLSGYPGVALEHHRDQAASRFLLRVATGLESVVRGEEQILGQLRDAFKTAEDHGLLSPRLRVLRQSLVAAARDLRQRAGLVRCQVSVASLAARQLEAAGRRLAVVGAGETGRLAIEALVKRGFRDLCVVNRTLARAQALADHHGLTAMSLEEFLDGTATGRIAFDGVLLAVHSRSPLLGRAHAGAFRRIVDASMPTVVDPAVRDLASVEVIDLDSLAALVQDEGERRSAQLELAETLVDARARTLHDAVEQAASGSTRRLAAIADKHLETAMQELHTVLSTKLRHLSESDREQVRRVMVRTVRRTAHLHLTDVREYSRT